MQRQTLHKNYSEYSGTNYSNSAKVDSVNYLTLYVMLFPRKSIMLRKLDIDQTSSKSQKGKILTLFFGDIFQCLFYKHIDGPLIWLKWTWLENLHCQTLSLNYIFIWFDFRNKSIIPTNSRPTLLFPTSKVGLKWQTKFQFKLT